MRITDEQLSDKLCNQVIALYNLYRDKPHAIEKERNIPLEPALAVDLFPEHESVRLMRSIAKAVVPEYQKRYGIEVEYLVCRDDGNQVIFEVTAIKGNKWK